MKKQMIISVGREYGSGGHEIASRLAEHFGLPLYDHNLLHEISEEKEVDEVELTKYDEIPRNRLFSRTVMGYSNSPEENIARMQFEYLEKRAEKGESFVIIGRCSETVLKKYDGLISIFVLGDKEIKAKRIAEIYKVSVEKAKLMLAYYDKKRKMYHNYYCKGKWGDSRNYDLAINSSKMGIDGTTQVLVEYINKRMGI